MSTLAVYLVCSRNVAELARAAVDGGADLIELGFPFSDPLADGPIIRAASERALAEGMRTRECLEALAETHAAVDVPLVPMTYASLLEAYGYEKFARDARDAGASSMIIADLPIDIEPDLRRIHLVAPTTHDERLAEAARTTDGWLYLVSRTGITGPRAELSSQLPELAERARRATDLPLYAGFGVSTPAQAAEALLLVDGVVVGSAAVQRAEESGSRGLHDYVASLREAMDRVGARRGVV
ncbi:MAG: tryptophan synthase subunit alpha [Actinomycetota bacterium]